jgi:hypothetical protein
MTGWERCAACGAWHASDEPLCPACVRVEDHVTRDDRRDSRSECADHGARRDSIKPTI